MDIIYRLQGVEFEWDENKARSNVEKHGVTFGEAAEVFSDPFYQVGDVSVDNEQRDFILGYSLSQRLLLTIYIERGERTRIISARPATRFERKLYEIKQDLPAYLQRVETGETLVIVKTGKPVAEIRPVVSSSKRLRPFGLCAGEFTVPDDFDEPLPENIIQEFEGK